MDIALTGGTGFLGAALIDRLIKDGHFVRILARSRAKVEKLQAELGWAPSNFCVIDGTLNDDEPLKTLCAETDWVVHCAGLTHARHDQDFFEVNVSGANRVAKAAADGGAKMVHISSMAASAPHLSSYAKSKFDSEAAVLSAQPRAICLRAPAMYGERDTATLPVFKSAKSGVFPIPGGKSEQRASILYVHDFVNAICVAMNEGTPGTVYEVGDQKPDGHSWREIGNACAAATLGAGKKLRFLALPKPLLLGYAAVGAGLLKLMGKAPMVTPGKIHEFFHPDWAARRNLLSDATSWRPTTSLDDGFARTAKWYRAQNML